jgi:hypothetical protein
MEKRGLERINETLDAEVVTNSTKYPGIIMNLSEQGVHMVTATTKDIVDIALEKMLKLKCSLPSGDDVDLECEVKWFNTKNSPYGVSFSIGMQIVQPPSQYLEYIRTLQ